MDYFLHTIRKRRGFTLAEMAIVVVLAGIIMTMGMKMTVANLNNGAYAQTNGNMALIKTALIAYLRINGTIPCPDITAAPAPPTGNAPANCNATVAQGSGVVPWKTLGLTIDTAQDGWGNFFTYRVDNGVNPQMKNWTTKNSAANSFSMNQFNAPLAGLTINQTDGVVNPALPANNITKNAVAVILSAGKNGYGARTKQGQNNNPPPVTNLDEFTNMTAGQTTFVVRPVTDTATVRGMHNDVLTYMLPTDLMQPLVTEQFVKACMAYCTIPVAGCTVPAGTTIPIGFPNPTC